jgi:hypothetical protein
MRARMSARHVTSRPSAAPQRGQPIHHPGEAPGQRGDAVRARDAGLRLARRVNRWAVGGAVAVAGALSALTAHAYHARAAAPRSTAVSATRGTRATGAATSATLPPAGATSAAQPGAGPQPPASVPIPAPTQVAPVVSGGS